MRTEEFWGAHAPSRADFGASPKSSALATGDRRGRRSPHARRMRSTEPHHRILLMRNSSPDCSFIFYDESDSRAPTRQFRLLTQFRRPLAECRARGETATRAFVKLRRLRRQL